MLSDSENDSFPSGEKDYLNEFKKIRLLNTTMSDYCVSLLTFHQ